MLRASCGDEPRGNCGDELPKTWRGESWIEDCCYRSHQKLKMRRMVINVIAASILTKW